MSYDYSFIGSEIRRIRKNRKISQKDLANMVGISEESLRRIENNHNNPRMDNFLEILEVLGIDFEIILMNDCGSSWYLINEQIKAIDNDLENLSLNNLHTNIERLESLKDLSQHLIKPNSCNISSTTKASMKKMLIKTT